MIKNWRVGGSEDVNRIRGLYHTELQDTDLLPLFQIPSSCVDYLSIKDLNIIRNPNEEYNNQIGWFIYCREDYTNSYRKEIPTIFSDGNRFEINLMQDSTIADKGFRIKWQFIDKNIPEYTCNFEHGLCYGWIQSAADEQNWILHRGETQTEGTGPNSDHTFGLPLIPDKGYYLYADSSAPSIENDRAILISPSLIGGKKVCFNFWYNLNTENPNNGVSVLYVTLVDKDDNKFNAQQISLDNFQNNPSWQKGFYSYGMQPGKIYYLVIMFKRGKNFAADVAMP